MHRHLIAMIFCLLLIPMAQADTTPDPDSFSISADQWAVPRSGNVLIRLQPIHDAVTDWLASPDAHIVIRHAGTDTGNLWAGELQDWLVALGVPADHIDKRVDADQPDDAITLKVER